MRQTRSTSTASTASVAPTAPVAAARAPWFRLLPADGILTLFLAMVVVYVTTFSIQAVTPPWVTPGMNILTYTTTAGLVIGYLVVQQGRLPRALVDLVAVALGLAFAVQQTAAVRAQGQWRAVLRAVGIWFKQAVLTNSSSTDDTVFLCFLAVLTFLLAYISLWLIVVSRRPWLMLLANGIVMLINLGASSSNEYGYVIIFAIFSMLLLVRFTLAENMRRWRARGIRFSPDLTWDYMQIGTIFAVLVLLIAYLLPAGASGGALYAAVTSPDSPWTHIVQRVEAVFGGVDGGQGGSSTFFGDTVGLLGTVHLTPNPVLEYRLASGTSDPTQYLITETYDSYDTRGQTGSGISSWTRSTAQYANENSNAVEAASSQDVATDTYIVSYDEAGAGLGNYLFAPGSTPRGFSVPASVLYDVNSTLPVAWHSVQPLSVGQTYQATGYVSTATTTQLQKVPYANVHLAPPTTTGGDPTVGLYPPSIVNSYLPDGEQIPPLVVSLARQWTAGATNMYQAATMIENHLRTFKYNTQNPDAPAGVDGTVWFLQRQQGFCTYFASAMALMGRSLGMPTRVVTGFSTGTYDPKTQTWVVRGTNAHAWPQIYFGTYGWINFEPTSSFSLFSRAVTGTGPGATPTQTGATGHQTPVASGTAVRGTHQETGGGAGSGAQEVSPFVFLLGGLVVLIVLLIGLFLAWWRALYRRATPVTGAFARLVLLGRWAGVGTRPDQTPREYAERLGTAIPWQRVSLEELADLYAQERWGEVSTPADGERVTSLYEPARREMTVMIAERLRESPSDFLAWLWAHRPGHHRR